MSNSNALANTVAVSGPVPEEDLLGRLATFTLPDEERSAAKLVRSWAANGLDLDDLPDARSPVHVFQSACASVRTRRASDGHGSKIEIEADEVENNGDCVYQVTVKVWDRANRLIEHEKAMRVNFDKQRSTISFDALGYQDVRLAEIEERIVKHFEANAKTLPGSKIRNAVRAQLLKIGAQNLRRKAGGLYFVPIEWRPNGHMEATLPILEGLAGVLDDLYQDRADFHLIKLMGDDAEKRMVSKHFQLNARERAEELTEKAIQRLRAGKGRGVRPELLTNLWNERRKLAQQVQQFDSLVSIEKQDLDDNLRDLDRALGDLQDLADAKDTP